jgi:hypothetical protein
MRDAAQRKADTLAMLTTRYVDGWVASASADLPYLVPLSLAWIDERVVLSMEAGHRTARNIAATGTVRIGLGPTRDVVLVDAVLERTLRAPEAPGIAERYAAQADWDPRKASGDYIYLVLRPDRIQAWRGTEEHVGRTLMRDGAWLV